MTAAARSDPRPAYALKRPSDETAGARNSPAPSIGPELPPAAWPSGPTSPRNDPAPPPACTSSFASSTHVQYIGEPCRATVASALASAGATRRSIAPVGSLVRNATARPLGIQYR